MWAVCSTTEQTMDACSVFTIIIIIIIITTIIVFIIIIIIIIIIIANVKSSQTMSPSYA